MLQSLETYMFMNCLDWTLIRERYLQDDVPVRLGGLAANLRCIKSFASHEDNLAVLESLLNESKFFIEWTAGDAGVETAAPVVELQVQLACWQLNWVTLWGDPVQRNQIAEQSRIWCDRILDMSGLLGAVGGSN